jgi:hypothetical protein
MAEPIFMKLGICITVPDPISTAHFINPSHQSVCLYVYPLVVLRQRRSKKRYRGQEHARNNKRIVGSVVFYAVRVVTKESRRLGLARTSYLEFHPVYFTAIIKNSTKQDDLALRL